VPDGAYGVSGLRALGGVAVLPLIMRRANREIQRADPEDPGSVSVSPEALKVAERAFKLGRSKREDRRAVAELVALAQGNTKTLENAERFSRQGARHCEDEPFNRANRLLVAALNGEPVVPASPESKQLFKTVRQFLALSPVEAWELLVSREPRLEELASETSRGTFSQPLVAVTRNSSPGLQRIAREQSLAQSELGDRLRELVGPIAAATDPLLTSRAAFAAALSHLAEVDPTASTS
jgi:hypothetical protein